MEFEQAVARIKELDGGQTTDRLEMGDIALGQVPLNGSRDGKEDHLQKLADSTGVAFDTLKDRRYVASRITTELRNSLIPWTSLKLLAGIEDESERREWLEMAATPCEKTKSGRWTVDALRDEMRLSKKDFFTLQEWQSLSDEEQQSWLGLQGGDKTFNRQDTDSIEWAQWSWNPVTGCLHNCPYCYARDIAERFYETKFVPTFHPKRLTAPSNTRVPGQTGDAVKDMGNRNVFTCSMADLFGKWVPQEWIEAVLAQVDANPQWNFLFLTKFPVRLAEFEFPDNAWVGTTVDCQARVKNAERSFRRVKAAVKWLSVEPMLEPLRFNDLGAFQWIVVGGASSSTQTPEWHPPRDWSDDLRRQAEALGVRYYEKTNLIDRIRQYPGVTTPASVLPGALRYLPTLESV